MATPKTLDLIRQRLHNHRLAPPTFTKPADVVRWFGAVQAQDYPAALWGIGLRIPGATESDVARAVADRAIVRTWPMRGTLHFVPAPDARWMVALLAPRVIQRAAARYRELGLDDATFKRARALFEAALRDDKQLTRAEMFDVLERAKIATAGQRGVHILGNLSMQGVLCVAAHRGKHATFALLEEWVPTARAIKREEALAGLARRYFTSHGPATEQDFAWWTGLPLGEARAAIALAGERLATHVLDGQAYLTAAELEHPAAPRAEKPVHLLPMYDEYTLAYRDRSAFLDAALVARTRGGIMAPVVAIDGRIAGVWARAVTTKRVAVTATLLTPASPATRAAVEAAAAHYARFLGLPAQVRVEREGAPVKRAAPAVPSAPRKRAPARRRA